MNSKLQTIRMFGPSLSGPARLVNRDVPVADEQAYARAGYQRGSVPDPDAPEPVEPVKALKLSSEELSLEEPEATPVTEPVAEPVVETPVPEVIGKPRRKKGQN